APMPVLSVWPLRGSYRKRAFRANPARQQSSARPLPTPFRSSFVGLFSLPFSSQMVGNSALFLDSSLRNGLAQICLLDVLLSECIGDGHDRIAFSVIIARFVQNARCDDTQEINEFFRCQVSTFAPLVVTAQCQLLLRRIAFGFAQFNGCQV